MGLGSEKVGIAYKTLLIIAETDTLEMPKLFVVFLWLFRHQYNTPLESRLTLAFLEDSVSSANMGAICYIAR